MDLSKMTPKQIDRFFQRLYEVSRNRKTHSLKKILDDARVRYDQVIGIATTNRHWYNLLVESRSLCAHNAWIAGFEMRMSMKESQRLIHENKYLFFPKDVPKIIIDPL